MKGFLLKEYQKCYFTRENFERKLNKIEEIQNIINKIQSECLVQIEIISKHFKKISSKRIFKKNCHLIRQNF